MNVVSQIKREGAARLYAYLLENGETRVEVNQYELMYKTGIGRVETLLAARRELEELGVIRNEKSGRTVALHLLSMPPAPPIKATFVDEEPEAADEDEQGSEVLEDRCRLVDALPEDGDPTNKQSNYQKKRKAALMLVKDIFENYFPNVAARYPMRDGGAKEWLRIQPSTLEIMAACESIAAQVEETGKPIDGPLAYMKKVLERRKAQGKTVATKGYSQVPDVYTAQDVFTPEQLELRERLKNEPVKVRRFWEEIAGDEH